MAGQILDCFPLWRLPFSRRHVLFAMNQTRRTSSNSSAIWNEMRLEPNVTARDFGGKQRRSTSTRVDLTQVSSVKSHQKSQSHAFVRKSDLIAGSNWTWKRPNIKSCQRSWMPVITRDGSRWKFI